MSSPELVIAEAVRSPLGTLGAGSVMAGISSESLLAGVGRSCLVRSRLDPSEVTRVVVASQSRELPRAACERIGIGAGTRIERSAAGASGHDLVDLARTIGPRDVVLLLAVADGGRAQQWPDGGTALARDVARRWVLDADELDRFALRSRRRCREVARMGEFAREIVPALAHAPHGCQLVRDDQTLVDDQPTGSDHLSDDESAAGGADRSSGSTTDGRTQRTGHVSHQALGAAATIVLGSDLALELGIRPRARVLAAAEAAGDRRHEPCGAIGASRKVLAATGLDPDDLDHYEVSETYASIPLAWRREFDADFDRLNPRGGSLGLGRPGSAAGLRSVATMLSALGDTGGRYGLWASEGSGTSGSAVLVELLRGTCCPGNPTPHSHHAAAV